MQVTRVTPKERVIESKHCLDMSRSPKIEQFDYPNYCLPKKQISRYPKNKYNKNSLLGCSWASATCNPHCSTIAVNAKHKTASLGTNILRSQAKTFWQLWLKLIALAKLCTDRQFCVTSPVEEILAYIIPFIANIVLCIGNGKDFVRKKVVLLVFMHFY